MILDFDIKLKERQMHNAQYIHYESCCNCQAKIINNPALYHERRDDQTRTIRVSRQMVDVLFRLLLLIQFGPSMIYNRLLQKRPGKKTLAQMIYRSVITVNCKRPK